MVKTNCRPSDLVHAVCGHALRRSGRRRRTDSDVMVAVIWTAKPGAGVVGQACRAAVGPRSGREAWVRPMVRHRINRWRRSCRTEDLRRLLLWLSREPARWLYLTYTPAPLPILRWMRYAGDKCPLLDASTFGASLERARTGANPRASVLATWCSLRPLGFLAAGLLLGSSVYFAFVPRFG